MRIHIIILLIMLVLPLSAKDQNKREDYLTGKEYYQKGEYDKARYFLLRAVREEPSDQQSLLLLVNIEERTKHYATAIVHVNEILALNPYNSGMWLKKIHLYRLQHNDVEADRLLERLAAIYPEKVDIQNRLRGRAEEIYQRQRREGDVEGQIASLKKLIADGSKVGSPAYGLRENTENVYMLCNLLLQTGRTSEAIDVIDMVLKKQPNNAAFIKKKVGILAEQGRIAEAYAFAKGHSNDEALLRDLEESMIAQAQINDPYILYGRIWEQRHTEESLKYLISTAMTRGYLDDAQMYIKEARKRHGDTPELLYKAYTVEKRLGNEGRAFALVQQMHKLQPTNQEYTDIIAGRILKQANDLFIDLNYKDAVVLYDSIIAMNPDADILSTALYKRQACSDYFNDRARKARIAELEALVPLLVKEHEWEKAVCTADTALSMILPDYGYAWTKSRIDAGMAAREMNDVAPDSVLVYPKDTLLSFILAMDSLEVLRLAEEELPDVAMQASTPENRYSVTMLLYYQGLAYERLHRWKAAYECLRHYDATIFEAPDHRRLLESLLAHELRDVVSVEYQQMRLGTEDRITANATAQWQHTFDNEDVLSLTVQYTGRDAFKDVDGIGNVSDADDGGAGIQVGGEYRLKVNDDMAVSGGIALANRYFPRITVKAAAEWELKNEVVLTARAAYRRADSYIYNDYTIEDDNGDPYTYTIASQSKCDMITVGATGAKTINEFNLSAAADVLLINIPFGRGEKTVCFNASAKAQYFPLDHSRTHVFATFGAGNAPELALIDNNMPTGFSRLNTFVGAGGFYAFSPRFGAALSGSWYNLFNHFNNFKNYFYVNASLQVKF